MSTQSDLPDTVGSLVDAVCNLVLDAVSGSISLVKEHCEELAQYTNEVVLLVQEVALSTRDPEFQIEITNCINEIATSIEKIIVAFEAIVQNPSAPEVQKSFALAAKEVGDAVNHLVVATDTSFSNKIFAAVAAAEKAADVLVSSSKDNSRDKLMAAAKTSADKCTTLVKICTSCTLATSDKSKAAMLQQSSDSIQKQSPSLIVVAKSVFDGSASLTNVHTSRATLQNTFNLIKDAAQILPSFGKRFSDAFNYVTRFLELAQDLEDATRRMVDAVKRGCTNEEFMTAAKRAAQLAKDLIQQAEVAKQKETDPVRKAQIEACLKELRDHSQAILSAAKVAQANPTAENLSALDRANQTLQATVKKMTALINPDDLEGKLFYTAQYLEDLANDMMAAAPSSTSANLMSRARHIGEATIRLAKDAEAVANEPTLSSPSKSSALFNASQALKGASAKELAGVKALSASLGDQALLDDLRGRNNDFCDRIHDIRVAAGFAAPRQKGEQAFINAANILESLTDQLHNCADTASKEELLEFVLTLCL